MDTYLSIGAIYTNLSCIQNAFDKEEELADFLVPDSGRKNLYDGGVYKWFYRNSFSREEKEAVIQEVADLTFRSLDDYLSKELSDWESVEYQNLLYPFIKNTMVPNRDRYIALFGEAASRLFEDLPRINRAVKDRNTLIQFIRKTETEIPEDIIGKLIDKEPLTVRERNLLKKWVDHLGRQSFRRPSFLERLFGARDLITASDLHKVLCIYCGDQDELYLEYIITRLGSRIFHRPDPKFLKKRLKWFQKRTVKRCRLRLELGEGFGNHVKDPVWHFDLVSPEGKSIVIFDNPVRQNLDEVEYAQNWVHSRDVNGLPPPPVPLVPFDFELSNDGFRVFDRFEMRIINPAWHENPDYVQSVVALFCDMLDNFYTPRNLDGRDLGWIDGRLYTTRVWTVDKIHVGVMISHLRKWTIGADDVYRTVLRETNLLTEDKRGILDHAEQIFFCAILDDLIAGEGRTVHQIKDATTYSLTHFLQSAYWIMTAAVSFQRKAWDLCDDVAFETGADRVLVAEMIKECYLESWSFGVIEESWKEEIIASIQSTS